jgi:hypothetical protein
VAEPLGDHMDRYAGLEQERGVCVAQVVEADRRHIRCPHQPVEPVRGVAGLLAAALLALASLASLAFTADLPRKLPTPDDREAEPAPT